MILLHRKPISQTAKILRALERHQKYGITNYELSRICLSWHRRLGNLRSQGYVIDSVQIKKGIWKYYVDMKASKV